MGKEVKILTKLVSDSRSGLRKAKEGSFFDIFAGNRSGVPEIRAIFGFSKVRLFVTENVYRQGNILNIKPARDLIHKTFEDDSRSNRLRKRSNRQGIFAL